MKHLTVRPGFTIVELLITIAIIGILATITVVSFRGVQDRAHDVAVQSDLKKLQTEIELRRADSESLMLSYDAYMALLTSAKITKASYKTSGPMRLNLVYCLPASEDKPYMFAALSKSGKRFYLREGAIKEYTGPISWDRDDYEILIDMCSLEGNQASQSRAGFMRPNWLF